FSDLFQKKTFAALATLMPDGTPQVTPVWIDYDGKHVIVNSARGRQKDKNMKPGAPVAVALIDPDNPYRHLMVRGRVAEVTEKGTRGSIRNVPIFDRLRCFRFTLSRPPRRLIPRAWTLEQWRRFTTRTGVPTCGYGRSPSSSSSRPPCWWRAVLPRSAC